MREAGQGLAQFQHLVDLFLVFGKHEVDVGILQHEGHFGGNSILVHGHRNAAQALHGQEGEVEVRAVVAGNGQVVASLEAEAGQAAGHPAHFVSRALPAPGLPDPVLFLTQGVLVGALACVLQQQSGEGHVHALASLSPLCL